MQRGDLEGFFETHELVETNYYGNRKKMLR